MCKTQFFVANSTSENKVSIVIRSNKLFRSLTEEIKSGLRVQPLPKRYRKCKKGVVYLEKYDLYTYADKKSRRQAELLPYGIDDPVDNEWSSNRILINEGSLDDSLLFAKACLVSLAHVLCRIGEPFRIVVCYNPPEPNDTFDGIDCTLSFYKIRPKLPDVFDHNIEDSSSALLFYDITPDCSHSDCL